MIINSKRLADINNLEETYLLAADYLNRYFSIDEFVISKCQKDVVQTEDDKALLEFCTKELFVDMTPGINPTYILTLKGFKLVMEYQKIKP